MAAKRIEAITQYFQKESSVDLGLLFGSRAIGCEREISDWDIGVYFRPEEYEAVEWWDFVSDFWKISQKAKSLPPED